jgi:flagellar hook-basal body complex protein FliE
VAISPVGGAASVAFDLLGKAGAGASGSGATSGTGVGAGVGTIGSDGVSGVGISVPGIGGAGTTASSFANAIGDAVTHLNTLHNTADGLAKQAVTGKLANVEDYLTAATEAQLTTQLTVAVRNKAVEAYQEIMRMAV